MTILLLEFIKIIQTHLNLKLEAVIVIVIDINAGID
jgi:hypothetical protein